MNINEEVKQRFAEQGIIVTDAEIDYAEKWIGRVAARNRVKVGKYQAVHHIDGDPLNNDLSNLMIVDIKRNEK